MNPRGLTDDLEWGSDQYHKMMRDETFCNEEVSKVQACAALYVAAGWKFDRARAHFFAQKHQGKSLDVVYHGLVKHFKLQEETL